MKKYLLTVVLGLVAMITNAQTFLGLPLSGSINEFHKQLVAKGFTMTFNENDARFYDGTLGNSPIRVLVLNTPNTKQVAKGVIWFAEKSSFYDLEYDFDDKKKVFVEKYGEPTDCFNYFAKPYYRGDGYELTAVRVGKYSNVCFWQLTNGFSVSLEVDKSQKIKASFENNENMKLLKEEREKKLSEGL
jgi:hypothetical protein